MRRKNIPLKIRSLFFTLVSTLLGLFFLAGCTASPEGSFGLKTAEYGQCRGLEKGEKIRYKKRLVTYVCEERHVLFGEPYKRDDAWYFKSGRFDGKRVKDISQAKVEKSFHNICQFEGSYGTGDQYIRKFYFNTKLKACLPFDWSGKDGIVPFDSKDLCEMNCFY